MTNLHGGRLYVAVGPGPEETPVVLGMGDSRELARQAAVDFLRDNEIDPTVDPETILTAPVTHEQVSRVCTGVTDPYELGVAAKGCQGGLSDAVYDSSAMREYLEDYAPNLFGYVGSNHRTVSQDVVVEKVLREDLAYNDTEIALFLSWKVGRWLADELGVSVARPDAWVREKTERFLRTVRKEINEVRREARGV